MDLSIFVAKIIAITYIAAGISILMGQIKLKKLLSDFNNSPALTFITGFFLVIIGALLVQYHNLWVKDWTVLVTIVGWAVLIKGTLLLLIPKAFLSTGEKFASSNKWMGVVLLVIGLLLGYFGFIV